MDFKNIPKGLFNLKKIDKEEQKPEDKPEVFFQGVLNEKTLLNNDNQTVERLGFNSAKENNGSTIGLSICLNRIYLDHKKMVIDDHVKQSELKQPYKMKLHDMKAENERIKKRKEKIKSEEIPDYKNKVDRIRKEISEIRENPERLTGDKSGRASFYIGLTILILLTIYLFIFYSSASYSSFFKEFTISEIGIANSIFDAQALSKAFNEGFTELILIITIPAVFLGLGYLIHKSSEKKGYFKYLFIGSLIFVTFIFDSIIAYEICEKIYNIKKSNSFQTIPDFDISLAFKSINFWLIIFAGFVVYIIWGLVFDFTIDAHEKQDKLRTAIKHKEEEIKSIEKNIDDLNLEIKILDEKENKTEAEISKLNEMIDHSTIVPKEFEQYIFHFMQGWIHWMSANLKNQTQQKDCEDILNKFLSDNIGQISFTNN